MKPDQMTSLAPQTLTFLTTHRTSLPKPKWPQEIWPLCPSSWPCAPPIQQLLHTISFLPKSPFTSHPGQHALPAFKGRVLAHVLRKQRLECRGLFEVPSPLTWESLKEGWGFRSSDVEGRPALGTQLHSMFRTALVGQPCSKEQGVESVIMF